MAGGILLEVEGMDKAGTLERRFERSSGRLPGSVGP